MPTAHTSVPHRLPPDEALRRVKTSLTELQARFGGQISEIQESWDGTKGNLVFKTSGFKLQTEFQVQATSVEIQVAFPWAALPFKAAILSKINETAAAVLA